MANKLKYCLIILAIPFSLLAQQPRETQGGIYLSFEAEKDFNRSLSLKIEEEVRLINNQIGFDRNVSSLGLDYSLFNKKVKAGVYYAFIYLYNNDNLFEPRHRYYFNLSYKETLNSFSFSWRGRIQTTIRDNNHGNYRINPRYVMKNKFEVEYSIWGLPWKPYVSCDFSTDLNDPINRYDFVRVRFQGGAKWRINRTDQMDFFIRWNEYLKDNAPRIIGIGTSYKMKF